MRRNIRGRMSDLIPQPTSVRSTLDAPNPQENKDLRKRKMERIIDWGMFLCGVQGGIPREQNRELTTT